MKKQILTVFLALALCMGLAVPAFAAEDPPTAAEVYQAMIAMKSEYPEGMPWTNKNSYRPNGGNYSTAYGCAAFAAILSDAAFGSLPARTLTEFTLSDVRVGDILRINDDSHSVIVLEVHDSYVVIAEGNYNSSIHWGRTLTAAAVQSADYLTTRYPEDAPAPAAPSFTDVSADAWYAGPVAWAVGKGITNGTTTTTFSPAQDCTQAQILTFLHRAAGEPSASAKAPAAVAASYADAVDWAYEKGMIGDDFDPSAPCTALRPSATSGRPWISPPPRPAASPTCPPAPPTPKRWTGRWRMA